MIVVCHQALGTAYGLVDDWPAAQFHYGQCLAFEAEMAHNPALAGNVWSGLHRTFVHRYQAAAEGCGYASALAILERQKANGGIEPRGVTFAMLAHVHQNHGAFRTALGEVELGLKALSGKSDGSNLRAHLLRTRAVCHLRLKEIEAGLAAAQSAADLFRSPAVPPARRNLGWEDVACLGCELALAGQSDRAIPWLRESIAHLEAGGAASVAAKYRIKLAALLRQLGRVEEACAELPAEPGLRPAARRAFLAESAELNLVCGRPDLAVADCRELVDLWRAHPCTPAPEIACAEALLAKACLAAGDVAEAETVALRAADALTAWRHPDAGSCLATLALAQSQAGRQPHESAAIPVFA
jgi:tetratricopeptide (TPR) repeat protein